MKRRSALGVVVAGLLTASAASPVNAAPSNPALGLETLGNRADLISGGDARVLLTVPPGSDGPVSLHAGQRDITTLFRRRPDGNLEGLVTGLPLGVTVLTAQSPNTIGVQLRVTNHPSGGPVFSGRPLEPWSCLPGALNTRCERPAHFGYQYMPVSGTGFRSYDPKSPAGDVATVTTDQGVTAPYIVRVETGTVDRSSYQIAVLADPKKPWTAFAPQATWDHKLEIPGDASCASMHGETAPGDPFVLDDQRLRRGIMVASPSLADNGQNCDLVIQAESIMMLKEHIVETYGDIRFTVATGCSGGSIFQFQSENAYPGLIDGLITVCSYPDIWSTATEVMDCRLLEDYYATDPTFTEAQRGLVAGHVDGAPCHAWVDVYGFSSLFDPSANAKTCYPADPAKVYNRTTNRRGVRCSVQDAAIGQLGARPSDGFAGRPYDNVGVAYGLAALKAGTITADQFVALNAGIGSRDIDFQRQAQRVTADPTALQSAYRGGFVNDFSHLGDVPILDIRGHDNAEIHHDFYSVTEKARLHQAFGNTENLVNWIGPVPLLADPSLTKGPVGDLQVLILDPAYNVMDAWLTAVEKDHSRRSKRAKVLADKPAEATDTCFDGAGQRINNAQACAALYPPDSSPRVTSGSPNTNTIIKCQLTSLTPKYFAPAVLTDTQVQTLRRTFPTGVCDYSKPGAAVTKSIGWLTYANGPGGVPLPAEPRPTTLNAASYPFTPTALGAGPALPATGPGSLAGWAMLTLGVALGGLRLGRLVPTIG
ncbi:MAG: DUF6351 family protein [Mycobacteriales bacterium]